MTDYGSSIELYELNMKTITCGCTAGAATPFELLA